MNRKYLSSIILMSGIMGGSLSAAQAGWFNAGSPSATWQNCNADSCQNGGSTTLKSDYAKTKYPILLAHGLAGFSAVGPLQYWHGVSEDLAANGAQVFVAQQASFQSSEIRSEQLLSQVKQILAITGAQKVNLVGHSQGGQSVRYVAGVLPQNVASVTTIAGVHKGTPVADAVIALSKSPVVGDLLTPVVAGAVNAFFSMVGVGSGHYYDQDAMAAMYSLSTAGSLEFNQKFPAGIPASACGSGVERESNGVRYYSWSGAGVVTNLLDPSDYFVGATSLLIPGGSDGLVPQCSSHLGTVIRDNYAFNHFDEVNQILGMVGFLQDPVVPYRQQANRLKNAGL